MARRPILCPFAWLDEFATMLPFAAARSVRDDFSGYLMRLDPP